MLLDIFLMQWTVQRNICIIILLILELKPIVLHNLRRPLQKC